MTGKLATVIDLSFAKDEPIFGDRAVQARIYLRIIGIVALLWNLL